jgi:uncharacterized protein (TIGR00255 family)
MKSMTGFGRSEREIPSGKLIIEVQSVNRKYSEINITLPKELSRFESEIRKKVAEQVQRGLLSLRIFLSPNVSSMEGMLPDPALMRNIKEGWEKLAHSVGYSSAVVTFPFLVDKLSGLSQAVTADEADLPPLLACLNSALESLDGMKRMEGSALAKDIQNRMSAMEKTLSTIEETAPEAVTKMRNKLKERMEEIFSSSEQLDERLLREVALFAERVDIAEEITRFRSHLSQFRSYLHEKTGPFGRKMDFLIQEMGREINTIGSKAMDARISHLVVEIKAELEKVREQVQNIE